MRVPWLRRSGNGKPLRGVRNMAAEIPCSSRTAMHREHQQDSPPRGCSAVCILLGRACTRRASASHGSVPAQPGQCSQRPQHATASATVARHLRANGDNAYKDGRSPGIAGVAVTGRSDGSERATASARDRSSTHASRLGAPPGMSSRPARSSARDVVTRWSRPTRSSTRLRTRRTTQGTWMVS